VLTVETGKQMTRLLVSAQILKLISADTDTHWYWPVSADTRYQYRSNPNQETRNVALSCEKYLMSWTMCTWLTSVTDRPGPLATAHS